MSIKNSHDTIGNRTRELLACRAVPQPTAPPRDPAIGGVIKLFEHMRNEMKRKWRIMQDDARKISSSPGFSSSKSKLVVTVAQRAAGILTD
jgi:hypothetical protein